MKKAISGILSLFLIGMFLTVLVGCGADIKAENEKLKTENTSLKSDTGKLRLEVQKLKEEIQKAAAEKDATIGNLKAENEAFKKQVEDLSAKIPKKKK
jgi:peptidoglycan hydrolase CwlO-like protein